MSEWELILHSVVGALLPLTALVFHVAGAYGIEIRLANIVEQPANSNGFIGIFAGAVFVAAALENFIYIKAVQRKPAFEGAVVFRRSRSNKEIRGNKPLQKSFSSRSFYIVLKNLNKFLFNSHCHPPLKCQLPKTAGIRRLCSEFLW